MTQPVASVIIPVWNEKAHIGMLLNRLPKDYEVIVVDDGSTDNTVQVARTFGHEPLILGKNHGKGYACMAGAERAKSEYLIFMDGDLQHDAKDLEVFANEIRKNDIVLGCRSFGVLPFHRRLSNHVANFFVNYITQKSFRDVQCGFRAIKKSKLSRLELSSNGYEFEIEMIIKASKAKMKIKEVPVSVSYSWKSVHGKKIKVGSRMHPIKSLRQLFYLFGCFVFHA